MGFACKSRITPWLLIATYSVITTAGQAIHDLTCSETCELAAHGGPSPDHPHAHANSHHHKHSKCGGHSHCHPHSSESAESDSSNQQPLGHPPHDSDECTICQHLSAAQDTTAVVTMQWSLELVEDVPRVYAFVEQPLPRGPWQSRAPPA